MAHLPSCMHARHGFSLIELLMVIAIIAVLSSLLMSSIGVLREQARRVVCAANLRSLTAATLAYTQDYRGLLLPGGTWNAGSYGAWWSTVDVQIEGYLQDASQAISSSAAGAPFRFMHCPSNPTGNKYGYSGGQPGDHPARLGRLVDCARRWNAPGGQPARVRTPRDGQDPRAPVLGVEREKFLLRREIPQADQIGVGQPGGEPLAIRAPGEGVGQRPGFGGQRATRLPRRHVHYLNAAFRFINAAIREQLRAGFNRKFPTLWTPDQRRNSG